MAGKRESTAALNHPQVALVQANETQPATKSTDLW